MGISKVLMASWIMSLLFLNLAEGDHLENNTMTRSSIFTSEKMDCGSACIARCQLSSRQRLCRRACGTCCARCNCVPPGTSGNHDKCPCYASLTTHGGRLKCP